MKRAGRPVYPEPNPTSDSEESVDEFTKLKDQNTKLRDQLRQQKDCAKRQSELASRERAKRRELEREKNELEGKLKVLKLAPTDGKVSMRTIDLSLQPSSEPVSRGHHLNKEIFAAGDFCDYPFEDPPSPEPAPGYKPRETSWRKTRHSAMDRSRLMKVHLHRERERARPPPHVKGYASTISFNPAEPAEVADSSAPVVSIIRYKPLAPIALEEYAGVPEEAIPVLRDGAFGYKSGVIVSFPPLPLSSLAMTLTPS